MIFKFFVIMGVSFIFEVISATIDFEKNRILEVIQYIFDIVNCSQGILIFIISVMQKKTYEALKKKMGIKVLRKHSQMNSSSAYTASTSLLSRISTNNRKSSTDKQLRVDRQLSTDNNQVNIDRSSDPKKASKNRSFSTDSQFSTDRQIGSDIQIGTDTNTNTSI